MGVQFWSSDLGSSPILHILPPRLLSSEGVNYVIAKGGPPIIIQRPLRARSRHLPPLALFMVHPSRRPISHHESTLHSFTAFDFERWQRLRDFSQRLCFARAKFATHETCPAANELHLKPTKATATPHCRRFQCRNVARSVCPPVRIRILSFTFNFGPMLSSPSVLS